MARRPLANALEIDLRGGLTSEVTPHAGVALFIELGRRSGVVAAAEQRLPAKRSTKGRRQGELVEGFVLLSALGGDCLDDFDTLRRDRGLAALLGYDLPAASTARQWLDRFHDPASVRDRPRQGSFIPAESAGLAGLRAVVEHSVRTYVAAVQSGPAVTLDVDAHLVESSKRSALPTYEGYRGYQPLLVQWAESGLVLADEFRDGNVPAARNIRELVDAAFASLPARADGDAWQVSVRSDSAAYEQAILDHWDGRGWRFAVSADMSPHLRAEIVALPFDAWQAWATEANGCVREWAEVPFVPSRASEKRDTQPYRYLAIRVRTPQGVLFGDGSTVKHFVVVTNDWATAGQALLEWQRGKAGTIEHVNHVLKNELAAGTYPSDKFGANAAWLRLQVLTHNLLELLKATALDEPYPRAAEAAALRDLHPVRARGPPRPRPVRPPDHAGAGGAAAPGAPPAARLRLGRAVTSRPSRPAAPAPGSACPAPHDRGCRAVHRSLNANCKHRVWSRYRFATDLSPQNPLPPPPTHGLGRQYRS